MMLQSQVIPHACIVFNFEFCSLSSPTYGKQKLQLCANARLQHQGET